MMGYSFVVFIILTIMMNLVYLIKQQMKAWKNLGNLIEEKEEKIQAKIDYD
jgi:F0F1-type ATP synthase membrane subunit b/b'